MNTHSGTLEVDDLGPDFLWDAVDEIAENLIEKVVERIEEDGGPEQIS
jgi:hypothetical protein